MSGALCSSSSSRCVCLLMACGTYMCYHRSLAPHRGRNYARTANDNELNAERSARFELANSRVLSCPVLSLLAAATRVGVSVCVGPSRTPYGKVLVRSRLVVLESAYGGVPSARAPPPPPPLPPPPPRRSSSPSSAVPCSTYHHHLPSSRFPRIITSLRLTVRRLL